MAKESSKVTRKSKKAATHAEPVAVEPIPELIGKDEIPVLPKQFSESLKRIGEQAKDWQAKSLTSSANSSHALLNPKSKGVPQKRQINWSIVSCAMTAIVFIFLVVQSVRLSHRLDSISMANKDVQAQLQALKSKPVAVIHAVKVDAAASANEESLEHELDHSGG